MLLFVDGLVKAKGLRKYCQRSVKLYNLSAIDAVVQENKATPSNAAYRDKFSSVGLDIAPFLIECLGL
ncbi:MAG TPA: hypothetical protein DCQ77_08640 [Betaproteobacteria bacterium]|nr:hypothetical protein [Betaproteobacteria bacterium]